MGLRLSQLQAFGTGHPAERRARRLLTPALCLALLLAGCDGGGGGYTQRLPDPPSRPGAPEAPEQAAEEIPSAGPSRVRFEPPEGWRARPGGGLRLATYEPLESDTVAASLVALPDDGGGFPPIVNMWRGQLGLEETDPLEIEADSEAFEIASGQTMQAAELTARTEDGQPVAIYGAVLDLGSETYVFKLVGEQSAVMAEKGAFQEALKKATVVGKPLQPAGTVAVETPAHWRPKALSSMRRASYEVVGGDGAAADLSVIAFPGDAGGLGANINRWRGQVGLTALSEAEAAALAEPEGDAKVVYLEGEDGSAILVAMVERGGETWFFKVMGPASVVYGERGALLRFVETFSFE